MTGEEMIALSKKHTLFEWSAQAAVDPIPVSRAEGIYFWTPEGKRFIDFNSQFFTNPPLTITETELRNGFGIIDRGLEITDRAVG